MPEADAADASDDGGEDAPDPDRGNIVSIQQGGDHVYMVSTDGSFVVVDVSDPAAPVETGYLDLGRQPDTLFLQGRYVYVASYEGPFHVVDVSDPAGPVEVGSLLLSGLYIIDVSDATDPVQTGFFETDREAWGVWVEGGHAYVNGRAMWILDVSSPEDPRLTGECESCAAQWDLFVLDGYAYTVGAFGVKIVDISDPSRPFTAGEYETVGRAYEIFVLDGRGYVAEDWEGLRVLDLSDVHAPRHLELLDTGDWTTTVVATEAYIFVGAGPGLRIFPRD
jgi:hypothetical protein